MADSSIEITDEEKEMQTTSALAGEIHKSIDKLVEGYYKDIPTAFLAELDQLMFEKFYSAYSRTEPYPEY